MAYYVYEKSSGDENLWIHHSQSCTYLPLKRFKELMRSYKDIGRWPIGKKGEPKTVDESYPVLEKIIEHCEANYCRKFENYHYRYFTKAVEFVDIFGVYDEGIAVTLEYLKGFDFSTITLKESKELANADAETLTEGIPDIKRYFIKATEFETHRIINVGTNDEGDIVFLIMKEIGDSCLILPFANLNNAVDDILVEVGDKVSGEI